MRIVIPGGSGQIGTILARAFHADGHDVTVLSRRPYDAPWTTRVWNPAQPSEWAPVLENSDVVINLAGRNVNCRYTDRNRRDILASRFESTVAVGRAIAEARNPPKVWLQASTATIYAHRFDAPNDEISGIIGGNEVDAPLSWRFSIEVAKAWEKAVDDSRTPRTRKVKLRSAMIMSPDRGGIFDMLVKLVRFGLGGSAAGGRQYVSWIHDMDFVRVVYWLIDQDAVDGVVNVASPNPLQYSEFMRAIRKAWRVPIGLPATKWMLEIGAWLMRSETELVLKSRRVVPGRLLDAGFNFRFPEWSAAVADLHERFRVRG